MQKGTTLEKHLKRHQSNAINR